MEKRRGGIGLGLLNTDVDHSLEAFRRDGQDPLVLEKGQRPVGHFLDQIQVGPGRHYISNQVLVHKPVLVQVQASFQGEDLSYRLIHPVFGDPPGSDRVDQSPDGRHRVLGLENDVVTRLEGPNRHLLGAKTLHDVVVPEVV